MNKIKQYIFKKVIAYVINDILRHKFKGWDGYGLHTYGIKEMGNRTNHKTGDDLTIVIDDVIFRK
jgi:hypothetical protein